MHENRQSPVEGGRHWQFGALRLEMVLVIIRCDSSLVTLSLTSYAVALPTKKTREEQKGAERGPGLMLGRLWEGSGMRAAGT